MPPVTRREFVRSTALAAVAAQLASSLRAAETPAVATRATAAPRIAGNAGRAELCWLDGKPPAALPGVTWGTPWPRGKHPKNATFALRTQSGESVPLQTWPLANWPDGSLKWTGHAVPANTPASDGFEIVGGSSIAPSQPLTAKETGNAIEIDTGVMQCRVAKTGSVLIESITRAHREIARAGRLVCLRQTGVEDSSNREELVGQIGTVTLEQNGPVRAVVKIEGKHAGAGGKAWLPFVVRLYFYAGGDAVRMMHTIIYDGDPQTDVIAGLGVRFDVALRGELHDRHVRFSGQDDGLFGEAVRGLTGLRRDPGEAVREAQIAGRATPPIDTWAKTVSGRLHYIPTYPDWTLVQPNSDGFEIRKRTKEGFTWLTAARGQRAGGLGYVGSPEGGVAFGLRNFWQSYPAQLDIRGATTEKAEITAWVWSPDSGAMDLRSYHDGMGQDTYDKQLDALEITYEDYEPGFDTPMGVARTSELYFWALDATPERARLAELAEVVRTPPVLSAAPEYMHGCGVFGGLWSPV
ncbi:MAG TPA: Tat pathway signal sequence domain protein, partial [Opitutus sp.]|nr:Tat pathway signal sequence domain protein [Opitutus sp.]